MGEEIEVLWLNRLGSSSLLSVPNRYTLYRLCLCLQSIRVILNDSYEDIRPDWIEWLISWFGLCVSYNHRCKIEIKKKTKSKYSQCNDDTQRLTICICTIIVTALTKHCRQMYNHHSIILGIFVSRTSKKRQRQIISKMNKPLELKVLYIRYLTIWAYQIHSDQALNKSSSFQKKSKISCEGVCLERIF